MMPSRALLGFVANFFVPVGASQHTGIVICCPIMRRPNLCPPVVRNK